MDSARRIAGDQSSAAPKTHQTLRWSRRALFASSGSFRVINLRVGNVTWRTWRYIA